MCLGLFCARRKPRDLRNYNRIPDMPVSVYGEHPPGVMGGTAHFNNVTYSPVLNGAGTEVNERGVELAARTTVPRRVFNGDYSQVPLENEEEEVRTNNL